MILITFTFENLIHTLNNFEVIHSPKSHFRVCIIQLKDMLNKFFYNKIHNSIHNSTNLFLTISSKPSTNHVCCLSRIHEPNDATIAKSILESTYTLSCKWLPTFFHTSTYIFNIDYCVLLMIQGLVPINMFIYFSNLCTLSMHKSEHHFCTVLTWTANSEWITGYLI